MGSKGGEDVVEEMENRVDSDGHSLSDPADGPGLYWKGDGQFPEYAEEQYNRQQGGQIPPEGDDR